MDKLITSLPTSPSLSLSPDRWMNCLGRRLTSITKACVPLAFLRWPPCGQWSVGQGSQPVSGSPCYTGCWQLHFLITVTPVSERVHGLGGTAGWVQGLYPRGAGIGGCQWPLVSIGGLGCHGTPLSHPTPSGLAYLPISPQPPDSTVKTLHRDAVILMEMTAVTDANDQNWTRPGCYDDQRNAQPFGHIRQTPWPACA